MLKKFGSNSCPFTVLINSDGTIYSKHLGYERGDEIKLEKEISETLGAKVDINHNKKGSGKLVINFKNLDQLQGILNKIK